MTKPIVYLWDPDARMVLNDKAYWNPARPYHVQPGPPKQPINGFDTRFLGHVTEEGEHGLVGVEVSDEVDARFACEPAEVVKKISDYKSDWMLDKKIEYWKKAPSGSLLLWLGEEVCVNADDPEEGIYSPNTTAISKDKKQHLGMIINVQASGYTIAVSANPTNIEEVKNMKSNKQPKSITEIKSVSNAKAKANPLFKMRNRLEKIQTLARLAKKAGDWSIYETDNESREKLFKIQSALAAAENARVNALESIYKLIDENFKPKKKVGAKPNFAVGMKVKIKDKYHPEYKDLGWTDAMMNNLFIHKVDGTKIFAATVTFDPNAESGPMLFPIKSIRLMGA